VHSFAAAHVDDVRIRGRNRDGADGAGGLIVEELRPLGAMMRARAPAYRESVIARGAAPEPEA